MMAGARLRAGLRLVPVYGAACQTRPATRIQVATGVHLIRRRREVKVNITSRSAAVIASSMAAAPRSLLRWPGWVPAYPIALAPSPHAAAPSAAPRSEERRVGKECRSRGAAYHQKKTKARGRDSGP